VNRVDALLDWAVGLGLKPAIRFEGTTITFSDLASRIAAAAAALAPRISRGDLVGLFCENTPDFVVAEYACFWLGATVCPLNRQLTDAEAADVARRLGLGLVLSDGSPDLGDIEVRPVPAGDDTVGEPIAPEKMNAEDGCLLLQTSGSTGLAKGVLLSHGNIAANYDRSYRWLGVTGADVLLMALPLYNTYGLNQGINLMATTGATLVLHRTFSPSAVVRSLREDGVTFFPAVPTMMTRLQSVADGPITTRAVKVGVGAAPTAGPIVADVWNILPGAHIYLGYGLSEATALVTITHIGTRDRAGPLDTCGRAVPGVEMTIDEPDETGLGELLLRGDLIFAAYVGTDQERPVTDGWLRTGDLARITDGELTIADRKRDLIIRGGQNIYPGDVERVLHQHPAVLEAAVIGRPHPDLGEIPVAYLVARPGATIDLDEMTRYAAAQLAAFKRPAQLLVVPSLPRGATGKLSKPLLREEDRLTQVG
jgi:long-chain acyl-CoA synthetase